MGKYQEALKDLTEAIKIGQEPEDPNVYANRAFTYAQLGQFKEAEEDIGKLTADNSIYYFIQGVVASLQKKPAESDFKKFEELVASQKNAFWFELKVAKEMRESANNKEKGNKKTEETEEKQTQKKKKM